MNDLERRLQELGGEIAYPATPRFDLGFERRPARACGRPSRSASRSCSPRSPAYSHSRPAPAARSSRSSTSAARRSSASRRCPTSRAQRVDFGERVSREEAERRVGFELLDLGEQPDAIFVRPDGLASVVYGDPAHPRLVLSQARGAIYDGFIKKTAGGSTIIDEVTVDGEPGLFVDGPHHFVMFLDENGLISDERDLPRRHGPALEPGRAAPAARGRPHAGGGARAGRVGRVAEPAAPAVYRLRQPERRSG